jgi:hypothetical protein
METPGHGDSGIRKLKTSTGDPVAEGTLPPPLGSGRRPLPKLATETTEIPEDIESRSFVELFFDRGTDVIAFIFIPRHFCPNMPIVNPGHHRLGPPGSRSLISVCYVRLKLPVSLDQVKHHRSLPAHPHSRASGSADRAPQQDRLDSIPCGGIMHMVSALRSRGWTGNPPAVTLTGANGPDGTHPRPVVEAIPLV